MSTITAASSTGSYNPINTQLKPQTLATQSAPQAVQTASKDADGDNDGSKGSIINVQA